MLWKRRGYFDKTIGKKVGVIFSKLSLSPNQWTILSLVFALFMFYFLYKKEFLIASTIFAFTAFIDMIDGAVAKVTKKVTSFGGYLDSVIDRVIEFIIIFGLFFTDYPGYILCSRAWLMLLLFGSFMSTYTRAVAFEKKISKDIKGGVLEHTDRLILFFLIILISNFSLQYASYLIITAALLTNISALQRFLKAINK